MRRVALLLLGSLMWAAVSGVSACSDTPTGDATDAGTTCDDRVISCRGGARAPLACATATCGAYAAYCSVTHAPAPSQVPAGCVNLSASADLACQPTASGGTICTEYYCCPQEDAAASDASDASDAPEPSDASDASDALDASDASDAADAADD